MNGRHRSALALLAAIAFLALAASPAAAKPAGGAGAAFQQLQRELDEIVADRGGPPGIAAVIVRGRNTSFLRAGLAVAKAKRPIRLHDRVRVGAVSEAFGAFLSAGLGGVADPLKLASTVGSGFPGLLPNAEAVTVEQLLNHTSGLPDYTDSEAFVRRLAESPTAAIAPRELLGYVAADPLLFPPGSRYGYSASDELAIQLMDEATARISYEALLRRDVFDPIGMPGSSLPRTVGGIASTPADLARFVSVYVPTVLPAAKRLPVPFRPGSSSPPGPGANQAGIGIYQYESRCGTVYGEAGSAPGYRAFVGASANGNRVVVMVANAEIVPGVGSPRVSNAIRRAQVTAVCAALG